MRHIHVKSLWLQKKALQQVLEYTKIKGENNPADGLTKHVRQELAERYAKMTSMKFGSDRGRSRQKHNSKNLSHTSASTRPLK